MTLFLDRQRRRKLQEEEQFELLKIQKNINRFEAKFIPEPNSGCWLWLGALGSFGGISCAGHGQFFLKGSSTKATFAAHRASWMIYKGPLRCDELVLHSCDVPCCVNPGHLFVGDHRDNMQDARRKDRIILPPTKGIANSSAKLTEDDVREIRLRTKATGPWLAKRFGVSPQTISEIRLRKTWSHIE